MSGGRGAIIGGSRFSVSARAAISQFRRPYGSLNFKLTKLSISK